MKKILYLLSSLCLLSCNYITSNTSNNTTPTTGTLNGHDWVDLDLSVKWATCNVGANSPSDYGDYFAWGEISTKKSYTYRDCYDCIDSFNWNRKSAWRTYNSSGRNMIKEKSGHDAAQENWGGSWRMPSDEEIDELCKYCTWKWTSQNGHKGYLVTGQNGNSIFLPAAGFCYYSDVDRKESEGYYWSNTLGLNENSFIARSLIIKESKFELSGASRAYGCSIRPVTE